VCDSIAYRISEIGAKRRSREPPGVTKRTIGRNEAPFPVATIGQRTIPFLTKTHPVVFQAAKLATDYASGLGGLTRAGNLATNKVASQKKKGTADLYPG
jgi:hypothetical protein